MKFLSFFTKLSQWQKKLARLLKNLHSQKNIIKRKKTPVYADHAFT